MITAPALTELVAPVECRRMGASAPRPSRFGGNPTYYLRDLSRRDRRILAAVVALSLLPVVVSLVVAWMQGWRPIGDIAQMALRVDDVFSRHTPLIGQPSSGATYGGARSNHPGPIELWVLAVPSRLLGTAVGMIVGAAVINGAAIAMTTFVAFRRRGMLFALWSTLAIGLLAFGVRAVYLHDPISSAAATFATITMVYLVWALIDGDLALLPLAGGVTSFVLLDHLSYLGNWALFVVTGLVWAAVAFGLRVRKLVSPDRTRVLKRAAKWVGWTVLVVGVMWAPVLYQQFTHHPGNLTVLIESQTTYSGEAHGWNWALGRARASLGPVPVFLRHFDTVGDHDYLSPAGGVLGWLALWPLVALIGLGVLAWRRGRRGSATLAALALLVFFSGVYSASSLPVKGFPEFKASAMRWMWTGGLIVWTVTLWLLWDLFRRRVVARRPKGASRTMALGLVSLIAVVALLTSLTASTQPERASQYFDDLSPALAQVRGHLQPGGSYLIDYGGSIFLKQGFLFVGPAVALDLEEHGFDFYMAQAVAPAYSDYRIRQPDTHLDGVIALRDQKVTGPNGFRLIAVVPNLASSTIDELGPDYPALRRQVGAAGAVVVNPGVRALAFDPEGNAIDNAIGGLVDDPVGLLDAGLLGKAIARGYVTAPTLDRDQITSVSARIAAYKGTTFTGVFLGSLFP